MSYSTAPGRRGPLEHLPATLQERPLREIVAPYIAEFLGSFFITLTYLCNASAGDTVWAVTSNALIVMFAMYAFSHVSGANLNPCITLALYLARRHSFWDFVRFCMAQILGGVAAAFLFCNMAHAHHVDLGPKPGFTWWEATIVECLYTCMICFVFLNCAASRGNNPVYRPNGFTALAVGMCYIAGGYASMPVSGTVMNPAIAIGLSIADATKDHFDTYWGLEYLPMEVVGAFMSVTGYRLVRPQELDTTHLRVGVDSTYQPELSSRIMAEYIGTFYLVFTKALNNVGHPKAEAWSVAAALVAMQYSLRNVSGGHFNPAVSASAALASHRLCSPRNAVLYIAAQVFGGVFAAFVYGIVHHGGELVIRPQGKYQQKAGAVVFGELTFTCFHCYTILSLSVMVASSKIRSHDIAGLAVGMCFAVGGFAVGHISGAVLNPAMALSFTGLNIIGGDMFQSTVVLYVVYEMAGGLLACVFFWITHSSFFKGHDQLDGKMAAPAVGDDPTSPWTSTSERA